MAAAVFNPAEAAHFEPSNHPTTSMASLTSAAGLVGFLTENDPELRSFALHTLNEEIDVLWPEVSEAIHEIEALYEDESFPERELAALVASKVYYQLQEYNESMIFALGAGKLFNINNPGEYEDTIIAKCVDSYIMMSRDAVNQDQASTLAEQPGKLITAFPSSSDSMSASATLTSPTTPFSQTAIPSKSLLSRQESSTSDNLVPGVDPLSFSTHMKPLLSQKSNQMQSLQAIINRLFESCYQVGAYHQVVGIALEARNLDVLREAILRASQSDAGSGKGAANSAHGKGEEILEYVLDICMNVVQERSLRDDILRLILDLLNDIPDPDYFSIAKCVVYLDQHSMAANLLKQLIDRGDAKSLATAYQISFDLYDNGSQEFLAKVMDELPITEDEKKDAEKPAENGSVHPPGHVEEPKETDALLADVENINGDTTTMVSRPKEKPVGDDQKKAFTSIRAILRGTKSIELSLEFLYRNNKTDKAILNKVRDSLEARNSIFHTGVTFANAFMNSGTTNDSFFRENLEWLGKAVNWSKFTATAALGVIHRGNIGQGQKLLEPYLPKDGSIAGSLYSQGGSLYALGLIYTNHGTHVLDYLRTQFKKASEEVVQHGGALGLGVAGMGTGSEQIYDELKDVLYSDSAINGEAVGLSMGLVMLGTGNIKALEDMIQYAHDTQHEKIIRGLAMGMALVMYARQEAADELINGLLDDPDPTLRYGGIMTLALAYCGTSSNKAVRRLLHVAVSDVSDDVRRVAVMSLGFVLFRKPGSVPRMVELLAESYNPHVRYGATMALGIACAGTGLDEAIDLLEPMMKDSVDFVRQGALIALSMILVQQNEAMNPKVTTIRKQLQKTIGDRHEDAMAKFGCALALGIIDAGGRNCTIGLQTQTGNLNMTAIVGMAVFTQYWYWFPLTHFLSLSFTPTSIIAVDQDLEIPQFKYHSNTRPSMFDYPPEQEVKAEEAPEKVKTAVLSTTAQAKRRKQAKEKQASMQRRGSMDVDQAPTTPKIPSADEEKMDVDEPAKAAGIDGEKSEKADGEKDPAAPVDEKSSKKKVEKEKVGYDLDNMSRVLPAQVKYISFPGDRYVPVKKPTGGVLLVLDKTPSEAKTLLELKVKKASTAPAPGAGQAGPSGAAPSGGMNAANLPMSGEDAQAMWRRRFGIAASGADGSAENMNPMTPANRGVADLLAGGAAVGAGGAAAAAAVLNAVDEDDDEGHEASVPDEFEYETDAEDEE